MSKQPNIFCEHVKVGDRLLFEETDDSAQVETTPAFRCGIADEPCKFATRKQLCPIYQEYLLDRTDSPPKID
jgi:hypothetical protein